MRLDRRQALLAGAALPFAAGASLPTLVTAANHAEPMSMLPTHRHFALGDFRVTTLLSGSRSVPDPQTIFGLNVEPDEFAEVSREAFIPADAAQFFFTPTVVETGSEVILFDTGNDAAGLLRALEAAGMTASDVDTVVLTHMHGDHIGGLTDAGGAETFAGARYVTGQTEFDHWSGTGNEGFEAKVRPLAEKMEFIGDGGSVASGVTGMNAFGHTPGHMVYMLESGGSQLLLMADTANHYVWSVAYPEWEVRFDADKAAAAQTRKRILGMAAVDRIPLVGYHMPFPGAGFIDTRGDSRFHYVPVSYQLM